MATVPCPLKMLETKAIRSYTGRIRFCPRVPNPVDEYAGRTCHRVGRLVKCYPCQVFPVTFSSFFTGTRLQKTSLCPWLLREVPAWVRYLGRQSEILPMASRLHRWSPVHSSGYFRSLFVVWASHAINSSSSMALGQFYFSHLDSICFTIKGGLST